MSTPSGAVTYQIPAAQQNTDTILYQRSSQCSCRRSPCSLLLQETCTTRRHDMTSDECHRLRLLLYRHPVIPFITTSNCTHVFGDNLLGIRVEWNNVCIGKGVNIAILLGIGVRCMTFFLHNAVLTGLSLKLLATMLRIIPFEVV